MFKGVKRIGCIVLAAIMLCGLFGCAKVDVHTPYSISQKIISLCSDDISWYSLSREQAAAYYGLAGDFPESFAAYISDDDARFDAVAVFTFKTLEEKKELAGCFGEIISGNKGSAELVNDNESSKIQNSVVLELDGMLIFVAADNAKQISEELQKLGAEKYVY